MKPRVRGHGSKQIREEAIIETLPRKPQVPKARLKKKKAKLPQLPPISSTGTLPPFQPMNQVYSTGDLSSDPRSMVSRSSKNLRTTVLNDNFKHSSHPRLQNITPMSINQNPISINFKGIMTPQAPKPKLPKLSNRPNTKPPQGKTSLKKPKDQWGKQQPMAPFDEINHLEDADFGQSGMPAYFAHTMEMHEEEKEQRSRPPLVPRLNMGKLNINQYASASPSSQLYLQQFESPIDNQPLITKQEQPTRTLTIPKLASKSHTSENTKKPVIAPLKIEESNSSKRSNSKSSFQVQNTMKNQNKKQVGNQRSIVSKSSLTKLSHMNSRASSDHNPPPNNKKRQSQIHPSVRPIDLNSINKQKLLSNCEHSLEFMLVAICKAFDFQNAIQAAQFVARGSNSEYASRLKNIDNFAQLNQFLSLLQTNLKTLIKILESENDFQLHNGRGKRQQDTSQNKIMSIISMGLQLSVDERIVWQTCNLLSAIFQNLNGFSWVLNCDQSGKLQEITPSSEDFISCCLRARQNHSELNHVIMSLFYEAANLGSNKRKKNDSSVSQLINLFLIALPNYFRDQNEFQFYQLVQEIIGSHFFQYEKERLDKQHLLFTVIDWCIDHLNQVSLIDFHNMETVDHEFLRKSLNLRQSCITLLCSIWINNEQIFHLSVAKFQATYSQLQVSCCSEYQNLSLSKFFNEFQPHTPISKIVLLMLKRNLSDPSKLIRMTIYHQLALLLKLFANSNLEQLEEIVFKQLSYQYITLLKSSRSENNLELREVISSNLVEYLEHAKKPDLLSFAEMFFKQIKNQIVMAQNEKVASLPSPMFDQCDLHLLKAIVTSSCLSTKVASILYTALAQSIFFDKFNDYTCQKYLTKLLIRLFTGFEQELAANWAKLFQLGCSVLSKIDQQLVQFHVWFKKLLREPEEGLLGGNGEILRLVRRSSTLTSKSASIETNQQQVLNLILKKELIIQTLLSFVIKSQLDRKDPNSIRHIAQALIFEQRLDHGRSLGILKQLIEKQIQKLQQQTKRRSLVSLNIQKTLNNARQQKTSRKNVQIYVSSPIKDIVPHNQYKGRRQTIAPNIVAQINGLAAIQAQRQFHLQDKLETFSNPLNNSNVQDEIINLNQKPPRRNSVIIGFPLYFKMDTNVPDPSENSAYMNFKFKKDIDSEDSSSITTLRTEIYTSDAGDDDIGVNAYVSTYKKKQIEEQSVEFNRMNSVVVREQQEMQLMGSAIGQIVTGQNSSLKRSEVDEDGSGLMSAKRSKSFVEKKEPEPEIQKGGTKEFAGVMGIIRTKKQLIIRARKKQEEKTNKAIYDVVKEAFKIVARDIEEIERKGLQSAERLNFINELMQKFNENDMALKEKLGLSQIQQASEMKPKAKKAVVIVSPKSDEGDDEQEAPQQEVQLENADNEEIQSHSLSDKGDGRDTRHIDPRFTQAATISIKSSFMPKKTIILEESMEMSKKNMAVRGMQHSSQDSMTTEPNDMRIKQNANIHHQQTIPVIESSGSLEKEGTELPRLQSQDNMKQAMSKLEAPNQKSASSKGRKSPARSSRGNTGTENRKKLKLKTGSNAQQSKKQIKSKVAAKKVNGQLTAQELDSRIADLKMQTLNQKRLAGTSFRKQAPTHQTPSGKKASFGKKKQQQEILEHVKQIEQPNNAHHQTNQDLFIADQSIQISKRHQTRMEEFKEPEQEAIRLDFEEGTEEMKPQLSTSQFEDNTPKRVKKQISALFRKDSIGDRRKSQQIYEQQMKSFGFGDDRGSSKSSGTLRDTISGSSRKNLRPQSFLKSVSAHNLHRGTATFENQITFQSKEKIQVQKQFSQVHQSKQPLPVEQPNLDQIISAEDPQQPQAYQAFLDQLKNLQQLQISLQMQLMNIQSSQVSSEYPQFIQLRQEMDRANQLALQLSQFQIPQAVNPMLPSSRPPPSPRPINPHRHEISGKKSNKQNLAARQQSRHGDFEVDSIKSINLNLNKKDIDNISQKASEKINQLKMRRSSKLSASLLQSDFKIGERSPAGIQQNKSFREIPMPMRMKSQGNVFVDQNY